MRTLRRSSIALRICWAVVASQLSLAGVEAGEDRRLQRLDGLGEHGVRRVEGEQVTACRRDLGELAERQEVGADVRLRPHVTQPDIRRVGGVDVVLVAVDETRVGDELDDRFAVAAAELSTVASAA